MKSTRMYHAERKERFLSERPTTPAMEALFRNVFDMVAPYEEEKNADVCTWNEGELKKVLEILSGFRNYSSENRAQLLRRYIRWCIDTGVEGATDAVFHVRADGLSKVREMTLSGPAHLQRCLDAIFSPVEDMSSDNTIRGYCWLAYFGMDEDDIVRVTSKSIDYRTYRVKFEGSNYKMFDVAYPCLHVLTDMSAFRFYHPGYEDGFIWRPRMDGDRLLRGVRSAEPPASFFRSKLSKLASDAFKDNKIDVKISYFRIWISGEFYRAYLRERAGEKVDFSHLAERAVLMREEKGKPYKLASEKNSRTEAAKKREISSDYMDDYIRWKNAYAIE